MSRACPTGSLSGLARLLAQTMVFAVTLYRLAILLTESPAWTTYVTTLGRGLRTAIALSSGGGGMKRAFSGSAGRATGASPEAASSIEKFSSAWFTV